MDPFASSRSSAYLSGDEYKSSPTYHLTQGAPSCQPDQWQAPLDPILQQELDNYSFNLVCAPTPLLLSDPWYLVDNTCPIISMLDRKTAETERPSSRSTITSTDTSSDPTYVPTPSPSPECMFLPAVSSPASKQTSQRHRRQRSSSSYPFASVSVDADAAKQNLLQYVKDHKGGDIPPELLLALLERRFYPPGTEGKGARDGPAGYMCRWTNCTKVVTRRDHARDHVATHVDIKPYECTKCTRRFLRPYDLTRHGKKCHIRWAEVRESCKAIDLFSFHKKISKWGLFQGFTDPPSSSLDPPTTFEYIRATCIGCITWVSHRCHKITLAQKSLLPLLFESSWTMVNPVTVCFSDWSFSTRGQWLECQRHEVSRFVHGSGLRDFLVSCFCLSSIVSV